MCKRAGEEVKAGVGERGGKRGRRRGKEGEGEE